MTFEEWLEAKPQPRDIEYQTRVGESIRQGYVNEYRAVGAPQSAESDSDYLMQDRRASEVPPQVDGDFSDYAELQLTPTEKRVFEELRQLADDSGYEYGCVITPDLELLATSLPLR